MGGAITFLALFPKNYIHWQQHNMSRSCDPYSHVKKREKTIFQIVRRKLHMVGIHSTVKKRTKKTPDITVETTRTSWFKQDLDCDALDCLATWTPFTSILWQVLPQLEKVGKHCTQAMTWCKITMNKHGQIIFFFDWAKKSLKRVLLGPKFHLQPKCCERVIVSR